MRRHRRVKILATLGPASSSKEMISKLFIAGVDVFRLNMSHLPREKLGDMVHLLRDLEKEFRRPVGILVDLQGPKLRVGNFEDEASVQLQGGMKFRLDANPMRGDSSRVCLPHPEILNALEPGHTLILDDGKLRLVVESAAPDEVTARVVVGGMLKSRKGISLPDTVIPVSAMTEKDRGDAEAALQAGVDWIALSFVQRPEDIAELRRIVGRKISIMAKIEKPQAIQRLEAIAEAADALMVARGDLGVEMPLEKVPGAQKKIIRTARSLGKPVVVATQMLESMIIAPVPTRAEVSDVATAVYEGADTVMLSAESASGQFPVEAVTMMNRIIEETENDPSHRDMINTKRALPETTGADAIAASAHQIAGTLNIRTICAWTSSGSTALRIGRERPDATVIALTPNVATARQLSLVWGIHPVLTKDASDVEDMASRACKFAVREGFAAVGDRVTIIAGVPFGTSGATNMVRIAFVAKEHAALA
ncbi:MAG: pyruvate kinase [Beijerinckiaceae bacterium]